MQIYNRGFTLLKQAHAMDTIQLKKYLRRNNVRFILLLLLVGFIQCKDILDMITSDVIWPEKPPLLNIGDTLIYRSDWNVDSFYVEEATLYNPGEINPDWYGVEEDDAWMYITEDDMEERFFSSMLQIDCADSCYKFVTKITPVEYWVKFDGIDHSGYKLFDDEEKFSQQIGKYKLIELYKKIIKTDTITGMEISTVYYSKKYGVVEYELTNGEAFYIEEECITRMNNNH
ncbi:MAG TPA: hypothetical protein PLK12_15525 [Prolixibacteraceae bacterium]|nr:hypothetical protein [Prolixibacteraceae bacterium]